MLHPLQASHLLTARSRVIMQQIPSFPGVPEAAMSLAFPITPQRDHREQLAASPRPAQAPAMIDSSPSRKGYSCCKLNSRSNHTAINSVPLLPRLSPSVISERRQGCLDHIRLPINLIGLDGGAGVTLQHFLTEKRMCGLGRGAAR